MRTFFTNLSISIALSAATPALAIEIVGTAAVIDGDTVKIGTQRIRLYGIDAPERNQLCKRMGLSYRCGQAATHALIEKIGGRTIRCTQKDVDRYKRVVSVCRLGKEDLNAWMVRHGHAVAYHRYSTDYATHEEAARSEQRGIWDGEFIRPWRWRRGHRQL